MKLILWFNMKFYSIPVEQAGGGFYIYTWDVFCAAAWRKTHFIPFEKRHG